MNLDFRTTSEDEAQQKYETVIAISMRGLELFLRSFAATLVKQQADMSSAQSSLEKLEKLLTNQKFWKFAKDTSVKVNLFQRVVELESFFCFDD